MNDNGSILEALPGEKRLSDTEGTLSQCAPHSIEAEIELLGMLIRDNNVIDQVDNLRSEHFYYELHGEIFHVIKSLLDKSAVADIVSIGAHLQNCRAFIAGGGKDYLKKLAGTLTLATARSRGDIIYSLFRRRRLVEIGKEIVSNAYDAELLDIGLAINDAETKLYGLVSTADAGKEFRPISGSIDQVLRKFNQVRTEDSPVTGIPVGFRDLDKLLGGLKHSDLVVLAARPSMGKTALAVHMAYNIACKKQNGGVGFFSLEMSAEQIALRIMSIHSGYSTRTFNTGRYQVGDKDEFGVEQVEGKRIDDETFNKIAMVAGEVGALPFFIDDTPAINIATLYARARHLKRKRGISVIMVDYLQLVRAYTSHSQMGNRVQEISEITQGLKAIAKDLNIPVVALSQLSRAVEGRDDKRPQLADLRESGAIEQDADIVIFLYREAYYMERSKPIVNDLLADQHDIESLKKYELQKSRFQAWENQYNDIHNLAELIVAKNRNGPIGNIQLAFERNCTKFSDRTPVNHDVRTAGHASMSSIMSERLK